MFAKPKLTGQGQIEIDEARASDEETVEGTAEAEAEDSAGFARDYGGGKWGRYLRAPDFYFEIMREFGYRFVRLVNGTL